VSNRVEYDLQAKKFIDETKQVQTDELVENFDGKLFNRKFIHNRYSQLIFKITDTEGNSVTDFDLLFTGPDDDPNHLPEGFFMDRQMNRVNRNTVTYYFNYDVMSGEDITGKAVNPGKAQANTLGLEIRPRPSDGFVRYLPCKLEATVDYLEKVLQPNTTTLLDIVLQRIVDKEVFRLKKNDGNTMPSTKLGDFSKIKPGKDFVE
jgi:hypothetical protein